jgi:hypothetical protein
MTLASLRNTAAFVALIGAALLGGTAPASGASITYSDAACASFTATTVNGNLTVVCSGGGVPTGAPTGCSIPPVSSLPAGGGLVNLSVSCSGGDPVTNYHWTASPSAAGLTANTPGTANSATITATTAFTVVASNGAGTGQATTSVQVGGVAGGISCAAQGFSKTMSYTWNWANAGGGGLTVQTSTDPQGPIGQNGIIVVAFTPMVSVPSSAGTVAIAPYGAGSLSSTTRTTTISTTPCTLDAAYPWQHVGSDAGTAFTVGVYNTRLYPALVAGTTYYINIAMRNATGTSTCGNSGSACDVRVQFSKPQQ